MITDEWASQVALKHLARTHPEWPTGIVQSVELKGPHYIVTIMPENKMGIVTFFMNYIFWVNASTGVVEKMS